MSSNQLTLEDFLGFGKHKGEQIEDILHDDPSYLSWLYETKDELFAEDVIAALENRKLI